MNHQESSRSSGLTCWEPLISSKKAWAFIFIWKHGHLIRRKNPEGWAVNLVLAVSLQGEGILDEGGLDEVSILWGDNDIRGSTWVGKVNILLEEIPAHSLQEIIVEFVGLSMAVLHLIISLFEGTAVADELWVLLNMDLEATGLLLLGEGVEMRDDFAQLNQVQESEGELVGSEGDPN